MRKHIESAPRKWPFPPAPKHPAGRGISRGTILADICMVVVWGATIPGLMWLGTASGF